MIKRIDLHMHSNCSIDGEEEPEQLVRLAAEAGAELISLTDHNSIRGVARAKQAASAQNIRFLSGVELDASCSGINVHVLGYGIRESAPCFQSLEDQIIAQERYAGGLRIEMIRKCGIQVNGAWLCDHAINGVVTGELIAESALRDKSNQFNSLLDPYRPGGTRSDCPYLNFYWDYCAQGKPAYVPIRYQSAEAAIAMIHDNGGVAVLAHPGISIKGNEAVFDEMVELGIDGVEVFTSYHDAEMTAHYRERAEAHHLLMTCGSDYHGKTKPTIGIASARFDSDLTPAEDILLRIMEVQERVRVH